MVKQVALEEKDGKLKNMHDVTLGLQSQLTVAMQVLRSSCLFESAALHEVKPMPSLDFEQSIEELERRLESTNLEKHDELMHLQTQLNDSKEREFHVQNKLAASLHETLLQKTRADKMEVCTNDAFQQA